MLKIKDNVDLKELEKLGFVKIDNYYIYRNYKGWEIVGVLIKSRHIYFELTKVSIYGAIIEDKLSVLFDLIQAGLVEKVAD